jgi:hypothetical protein
VGSDELLAGQNENSSNDNISSQIPIEFHLTAPIKQCFHAIYLDTQPLQAITLHQRQAKNGNALPASIFDV